MRQNSWITSTELLFRPTINHETLIEIIKNHLKKGDIPLFAICYCIDNIMEAHVTKNLEPILPLLNKAHQTTYDDLIMLRLGYRYVTSTVMVTIGSKDKSDIQRVVSANVLMADNQDIDTQKVQKSILDDLTATINLYKLDDSGAILFQFLFDYPPIKQEYFKAGMDIATIIISGLSQEITKLHPELNWPSPATDLTILT